MQFVIYRMVAGLPLGLSLAFATSLAGAPAPSRSPPVDQVDVPQLRALIGALQRTHGPKYAQAGEHLQRLARETTEAGPGRAGNEALAQLQREVLLFDVPRLLVLQRHEINASHVYTYHNEGFRPGGGLSVLSRRASRGSQGSEPASSGGYDVERVLVSSPHGQILDCDLSYDGRTVLFSWRQKEDEGYHLWTVNVDGAGLRQLTRGDWHDYNGCWLPDGGIAFVSTRSAQFAYCWNSPVGVVHRMAADGSGVLCLSGNYLNDFTPYPLDDGRIIYSRWEYVDRPAIPIQSLWTLNPDGTGLAGYFGNRILSPATFMEARSIPGTDRIVCTMTGHNGPTRGAIGVIDRTKGVNAQEAIWNVTPDVPVPRVDEGSGNFDGAKPYSTPVPLDQHRFLVSARGPVLVRTFDGACQSTAVGKPEQGLQWLGALPLRPRLQPGRVPRGTRSGARASTAETIAEFARPDHRNALPAEAGTPDVAYLYLQDVYDGLEPHVKRGEVKRLRVVRELPKTVRINPDKRAFGFQFPVISAGATYAGKEVLGEVDVAPDGSASFEVPAGIPIYFMALDAQGRAVQRMRSFTHLMPGEVQGCIGCHETRGQSTPLPGRAAAMSRPFRKLEPPEWGRGGFDYAAVVQPVLDRHCVRCHSPATPELTGPVDLGGDKTDYFNVSYETLARGRRQSGEAQWDNPYTSWIPTYNGFEANILQVAPKTWGSPRSRLADLLLDGHPDRQGRPRLAMADAERRRILAWIDLNVPYYGTSETTHPESTGSRRVYPTDLDKTLADVAKRRCAECHRDGKVPRQFWTRLQNPQFNSFLLAPLAKSAGGTGACGQAVFASTDDADYQAILKTFDPALISLREKPRNDMPGAQCMSSVNRSCK
jgi:mono/diheme cytochrome c family protein